MSSSSFEPDATKPQRTEGPIRALLGRSLHGIRQDVPEQYLALCQAMLGNGVQLHLDDERFTLRSDNDGIVIIAPDEADPVKLATTSGTIISLVDGDVDVLDAILDEDIALGGSIDHLLCFDQALHAYLHGAVRSPASSNLLTELRALAEGRTQAK